MAAETQVGTAVVSGITNSGSPITITGFATFILDKASMAHMFDLRDKKDAVGFDVNLAALNEHFEVDIDFTPSGATRAAAAAIVAFPAPLAAITMANFKIAVFNATYVYVGGAKAELDSAGNVKFTGVKLRKYADSTQNTLLTGGAISG